MRDDDATGPRIPAALTEMARKSLKRWAAMNAQRDELVRLAASSGVGINEIARITGLAKTTVLRIVN
jgi:DNA invertase Pin-like site-specific DNA recombinase